MSKQEIIQKIIDYVNKNQDISSDKQTGIIKTVENGYELVYYITLRELWKRPTIFSENLSMLARIEKNENGNFKVVKSASELELLMVLYEINKKVEQKVCI